MTGTGREAALRGARGRGAGQPRYTSKQVTSRFAVPVGNRHLCARTHLAQQALLLRHSWPWLRGPHAKRDLLRLRLAAEGRESVKRNVSL